MKFHVLLSRGEIVQLGRGKRVSENPCLMFLSLQITYALLLRFWKRIGSYISMSQTLNLRSSFNSWLGWNSEFCYLFFFPKHNKIFKMELQLFTRNKKLKHKKIVSYSQLIFYSNCRSQEDNSKWGKKETMFKTGKEIYLHFLFTPPLFPFCWNSHRNASQSSYLFVKNLFVKSWHTLSKYNDKCYNDFQMP